jgi:CDGSH-type Zn-finger protein
VSNSENNPQIIIIKDGPYVVTGAVPLAEKIIKPEGKHYVYEDGRELPQLSTYTLCRCGKSNNPPFCDGMHVKAGFDGTETASKADYLDRIVYRVKGPALELLDDGRCAYARFCHRDAGDAWELAGTAKDEYTKKEAIIAACECPAGRLVIKDEDGEIIEPEYEPAIEVLQDPQMGVSGPLSVKGSIPIISSDGDTYEVRNRITLCRCGQSKIMPFCDAQHINKEFKDGFEIVKED